MKGSYTLAASVLAASTVALSSSSSIGGSDVTSYSLSREGYSLSLGENSGRGVKVSSDKEKFAPRFDGLRFIETLVTGHR